MELVYLWVEKYKNIHKQGFNFSPRFRCKYDEEKDELTIEENDDYIENFFGENINITAIVGKNGSGKSSVLETIEKCINGTCEIEKNLKKCKLYKNAIYCINNQDVSVYQLGINKEYYKGVYNSPQWSKVID